MTKSLRVLIPAAALAILCSQSAAAQTNAPPPGPVPPADNQKLAHDIFRDLVEVRSVHDVGTKGTADVIVKYLKANGFTDSEVHVAPEPKYPNQVNVVVRIKGKGKGKPVMWIRPHGRRRRPQAEDWTLPPFKFTEKDGYFYGRGTSDMKDEDAAVAASLIRLKKEGHVPDRDIIVAFTADEEVGLGAGRAAVLLRAAPQDLVDDVGLVINPDGGSGEIKNGKRLDFAMRDRAEDLHDLQGGHDQQGRPFFRAASRQRHLSTRQRAGEALEIISSRSRPTRRPAALFRRARRSMSTGRRQADLAGALERPDGRGRRRAARQGHRA